MKIREATAGDAEALAVAAVLRSGWLMQGPRVEAFEQALASYVGARHAVATNSCTTALHLALILLDIGPGDEVIVPSLTAFPTVEAILEGGDARDQERLRQNIYNLRGLPGQEAQVSRYSAKLAEQEKTMESLQATLSVLRRQEAAGMRVEQIVGERVAAGVESEMERTRARLGTARVRMRLAEVEGSVDVLRTRLAQLTGLPAESIETVSESVPGLPEVRQDENLAAQARANSPLVSLADARAEAQQFRAAGEHKALYPALDLVAQYSVFSRHNNYDDFFQKFQSVFITASPD